MNADINVLYYSINTNSFYPSAHKSVSVITIHFEKLVKEPRRMYM